MARIEILCVLLAFLMASCAPKVTLSAIHSPLFLEASHTSTIVARGVAPSGLEAIYIDVTLGDMVSCDFSGDLPSSIPCRANASTQTTTCEFAEGLTQGPCTATVELGRHSLVTYQIRGKSRSGPQVDWLPEVTYAGGERLEEAFCWTDWDYYIIPGMDCVTSFSPLSPIWWQTSDPAGGSQPQDQIDLGIFQDADYIANALAFSNAMNPPVMSAFFGTQTFARDYVNNRSHFTLWKGPPGGDKDSCRSSDSYRFSSNTGAAQAAAATDAEVLFFTEGVTPTTTPRSCAQLRLGGGSYIWINRPDLAPTIVHESGHMLYGLGDEYCCDSSYESISTPRNLFTSLAGCQAEATNIGVSTTLCVKLADNDGNTAERWHIFDGGLNIMRSIDTSADWRFTGERARQRLMTRCSLNDCF